MIRQRNDAMPPKGSGNKALKQHTIKARKEEIKDTDTYESQRRASQKYEKNKIEQLTVRLPKGSRQILKNYVSTSNKYESVNTMIKSLIENEIGQSLD